MGYALRAEEASDEVVVLSKKEFEQLQRENRKDKAKIKFYQEMQKGILSTANGEDRPWEDVRKELWSKLYG